MPIQYATYTLNGSISSSLAYPSLPVLIGVPFVLLTHGVQSIICANVLFLGIEMVLLFTFLPRRIRGLAPIIVLGLPMLFGYTASGVNDTLLAPFLLVVAYGWADVGGEGRLGRSGLLRAICFGLALSVQQLAWFILPFVLLGTWHLRRRELGSSGATKVVSCYAGVAFATFLLVNGPFIVWGPKAWVDGVLAPLTQHAIPYGQGLIDATRLLPHRRGRLDPVHLRCGKRHGGASRCLLLVLRPFVAGGVHPPFGGAVLPNPVTGRVFRYRHRHLDGIPRQPGQRSCGDGRLHRSGPRATDAGQPSFGTATVDPAPLAPGSGHRQLRPWNDVLVLCPRHSPTAVAADPVHRDQRSTPRGMEDRGESYESLDQHPATTLRTELHRPNDLVLAYHVGTAQPPPRPERARTHSAAPNVGSMPGITQRFVLQAVSAQPQTISSSALFTPEGFDCYITPSYVDAVNPLGHSVNLQVQLRFPYGGADREQGVRVALGQLIYGQNALIPAEARINGMPPGQTPVTARTNAAGIAVFHVSDDKTQGGNPIYFQADVAPVHGYPYGYSEVVSVLWR